MATSRRVGNYSTSAKAVIRNSDAIFDAAMSGKPDFTRISKEAIKGRSMERRAVTKAEAEVASAGLDAFTKTKYAKTRAETSEKVESIKRPARRFAGVVGALGTLSGAAVLSQSSKKDKAAHDEWMKKFDERTKAMETRLSQPNPTPEMIPDAPTLERPTLSTDQPSSGSSGSSGSSQSIGTIPSTLTGNSKIVADAIAGPESGDWGYEAFNQGGAEGGTRVLGKRGSHKQIFGTSLTEMTLSEIFHRQNTKARGLSFQEHLDSGGLHAVGRYQFIGDTLQDEVRRMGLDPKTTKFTPQIQDKIFFSHLKRVGNISPWVGPMQKYSQKERDYYNSLIPTL